MKISTIGWVTTAVSLASGLMSSLSATASLSAQRREIEKRLNQLWREGKLEEHKRLQAMYDEGKVRELARYFLVQDLKRLGILVGVLGGGYFFYRSFVK